MEEEIDPILPVFFLFAIAPRARLKDNQKVRLLMREWEPDERQLDQRWDWRWIQLSGRPSSVSSQFTGRPSYNPTFGTLLPNGETINWKKKCPLEEKCKDAQNIPFTFRLRLCSSLLRGYWFQVIYRSSLWRWPERRCQCPQGLVFGIVCEVRTQDPENQHERSGA